MTKLKWWQERVFYQIYPRSFKDTNGDGIGDLNGITESLDYLKDLGIGAIWLSPVYLSPDADNGYDVSDYLSINPKFGTMDDMDKLINKAKSLDIKLIMDMVINHTSDEHFWFQNSRRRIEPYTDYYIWQDKPNNWTSFFGEKCWVFDELRGQYYLHLFAKKQPDLNFQNPNLLAEIKSILKFWLDKGIDGFRWDVINVIHKSSLANGKPKLILKGSEHYLNQKGMHEIFNELRNDVLSNYNCYNVGETVFVDIGDANRLCDKDMAGLDSIFSFEHMEADQWIVKWFKHKFRPSKLGKAFARWQSGLSWNANYLENHDQLRCVSRFGDDRNYWEKSAKMLGIMLFSLKGTPYIYQGQEIGMTNYYFKSMMEVKDVESYNIYNLLKKMLVPKSIRMKMIRKSSRDNVRTPVQWDSSSNSGFSKGEPWLKVNPNYKEINVKSQLDVEGSIHSFYKHLIKFRRMDEVLLRGDFELVEASDKRFIFKHFIKERTYTVLLNFTDRELSSNIKGKVLLSNYDFKEHVGVLKPYEGAIIILEE